MSFESRSHILRLGSLRDKLYKTNSKRPELSITCSLILSPHFFMDINIFSQLNYASYFMLLLDVLLLSLIYRI